MSCSRSGVTWYLEDELSGTSVEVDCDDSKSNRYPDQVWYEDVGIPSDYLMINELEDLDNRVDPLIEKSIYLIKN